MNICKQKIDGIRCNKPFIKFNLNTKMCPECALRIVRDPKFKMKQASQVKKELKAKLDKEETWFQYLNKVKVKAQRTARIRDKNDPCLSCGATETYLWQGSHFFPAGTYKTLALNLDNIHKCCFVCNKHKSGNITNYKPALIKKIGLERFNELERLANLEKQMSKVIISKEEIRLREIELDEMIKDLMKG